MKYWALASILLSSCAGQGERPEEFSSLQARAKSVCEVLADPATYVGQRIMIHGVYWAEPHRRVLYDDRCPDSDLRVKHALHADGDPRAAAIIVRFRKKHPTVRVPVVYSAVVASRVVIAGCTRPNCYEYLLEEALLLGAAPHSVIPRGR